MQIICTYQDHREARQLDKAEIIVGRPNPFLPPDLDLSGDNQVSRTHARIWLREGHYWIEDLASKHGTWVNGVRIDYRRQLYPDDTIQVGSTVLEIAPPPLILPAVPVTEAKRDALVPPAADAGQAALSQSHPVYPGSAIQGKTSVWETGAAPSSSPDAPPKPPFPDPRVQKAINVEEFVAARERTAADTGATAIMTGLAADLGTCEGPDQAARLLAGRMLQMFPAGRRTAVLLRDAATGVPTVVAASPADAQPVCQVMVLRTMVEGRALLWRESLESLDAAGARGRSGACGLYAPMCKRHQAVGVLCVESNGPGTEFTETDLKRLLAVAGVAALVMG